MYIDPGGHVQEHARMSLFSAESTGDEQIISHTTTEHTNRVAQRWNSGIVWSDRTWNLSHRP